MNISVMRLAIKFSLGGILFCLLCMLGAWIWVPAVVAHEVISIFASSAACFAVGVFGNWLALRAFENALEKTTDEIRDDRRKAWFESMKP